MRVKQAGISSVFLWRRPPTGNATLCNIGASVFQGDALCPSRTSCESISSSACAWQQPVCNWWATFIALLCSGISFGWRGYGPRKRNGARARRPRQTGDFTQRTRSLCDSRPAQLSNARCDVRTRDNSLLEGVEPDVDMRGGRHVATASRAARYSFAHLQCPEPQSRAASRRRRTAPLRWRSTRRMLFRGRNDRELECTHDDS